MKVAVNYYEASYQFNSEAVEFVSYDRLSLVKRVSEKLNDVDAYRLTGQELWASIWIGADVMHVTRVSDDEVVVWDHTTGERYPVYPYKEYSI